MNLEISRKGAGRHVAPLREKNFFARKKLHDRN